MRGAVIATECPFHVPRWMRRGRSKVRVGVSADAARKSASCSIIARVVSFHPIFAKPRVLPSTEWILTTGFWFGRGDPKAHEISTGPDPIELARYSWKV